MKKGDLFYCNKLIKSNDFFKVGNIYELVYVDNEKERIEVCLKLNNDTGMITLDQIKENFNKIKPKKI